MRMLPLLATPVAIALVLASTAVAAQDKPKAAAPAKASTSVTAKPAKAAAQTPLQADSAAQKALSEREGNKAFKPAGSERGYKGGGGCHSEGSDA